MSHGNMADVEPLSGAIVSPPATPEPGNRSASQAPSPAKAHARRSKTAPSSQGDTKSRKGSRRGKSKGFFQETKDKLIFLEEKIKHLATQDGEGQHNDNAQFVSHEHRLKKIEDEHDKDHNWLESLDRDIADLKQEMRFAQRDGV